MELEEFIKFETNDIIQSEEDKRLYRGLELVNGIKVLLISDPKTDKSAASLDVHVGSMHEPRNIPGLAHFCEHMLFMGTEKYPAENEYMKFLSEHGGGANAHTMEDHTNYHFDIDPVHFHKAIDIFAQFFIAPLFLADSVEREACAVDSEYLCFVPEDCVRFEELKKRFSKPDHEYQKFGCGNKKTLLEEPKLNNFHVRDELLKFYNAHYSSNIMTLCVLAKESLDKLKQIIVPIFSLIPNKDRNVQVWSEHPYGKEQVGYQLNVVPIKDVRSITIWFPIPDLQHHYKSKPDIYLASLVGHESRGSLLSELKKNCWATSLYAWSEYPANGFGFFNVDIKLTEEGLERVNDVVSLVFQYLKMLQNVGPQEWFQKEMDEIRKINFRFMDKQDPGCYVVQLAKDLQQYPLQEVLCAQHIMPEYKPELILDLLERVSVDNFTTMLASKSFEGKTDKTEQWYNIEYKIETVSVHQLSTSISGDDVFMFPEPNEFIAKNFKIWPAESEDKKMPEILFNDAVSQIWHKQDDEFFLPKSFTGLYFRSPLASVDPLHTALCHLYVDMLTDHLDELSYNASQAGLYYGIYCVTKGIHLSVSGYNDKLSNLLNILIENMVTFSPNPKKFDVLKEKYLRQLKDREKDQPCWIAMEYNSVILQQDCWTNKEILIAASSMNIDQMVQFIPRFFSTLHITAYIHGNTTIEITKSVVDKVHETINKHASFQPLFSSQFYADRRIQLLSGYCYLFEMPNDIHINSGTVVVYQIEVEGTRENMLSELLVQLMEERCFDQLRTKEQLGYVVGTYASIPSGVNEISLLVQGEKTSPFFDSRIEAFVENMEKTLTEMTLDEFEKHKSALSIKRLERPKELSRLAGKYFNEILRQQYHFDRDNVEVEMLKTLSKEDIIAFYQKYVKQNGPCRKKLSVYIKSTKSKQENLTDQESACGPQNTEKISDVYAFKSQLPVYPIPKPYMEIPISGIYSV